MANDGLTVGQMLPGFYGKADYNAQGAGVPPNLSCLIWGYVSGSATAPLNQPFRPTSQLDAANQCGGVNTDLCRMYTAAMSQPEAQGADVVLMPIAAPSSGTASVYKLKVVIAATNPTKAGTLQLWIASQACPAIGFGTTDTATTIGDSIAAALLATPNAPIVTATNSGGTITVTYIHKGLTGEDLPVRASIAPLGSGFTLSPGQALFATNATGAGSVVITVGAVSVSTALAGGETPAQIATKVIASWNANAYPLNAVVDGSSSATVNFFFNNNWDVRRMSAAVVTSTGTTVDLGSGATSGVGSASSLTYNGTQGAGAASVSQAVTNLTAQTPWFRSWVIPWTDATTIGSIATYIEAASNGSITGQKLQILTLADWRSLAVAGAVPAAVSPNLTTANPHYGYCWSPDVAVQAFEVSARVAVARAAKWIGTPQFNWNGFRLQGNTQAPILQTPTVPSKDTLNSALRTYGMAPVVTGTSGNLEVVKGRTTSLAGDLRLWAWSSEAQAAYHIFDLTNHFQSVFQGGSIVRYTEPKAPGLFDTNSVIDVIAARLRLWEQNGNYDGAKLLTPSIKAIVNVINPFRFDADFPESPVLDLDQIGFASHFTSPAS